jgi:hypothetical protein
MPTSLEQGILAYQAGNKQEATRCFAVTIQQEPQNTSAWFWLSTVVDDPVRKKYCLEKVLKIDPSNRAAITELATLEKGKLSLPSDGLPDWLKVPIPPTPDALPWQPAGAAAGAEIILFSDENVTVSDRRVLTVKNVYPLSGINSAGIRKIRPVFRYFLIVLLPLFGGFGGVIGGQVITTLLAYTPLVSLFSSYFGVSITIGLIVGLVGFVVGIIQAAVAKPKYALLLNSWSNDISIFISKDLTYIEQIVASINQSIRQYGGLLQGQSGPLLSQPGSRSNSAWKGREMAVLIIGSILMPIFGLVYGVYGLTKELKRGQAAIILMISIVSFIIYSSIIKSLF